MDEYVARNISCCEHIDTAQNTDKFGRQGIQSSVMVRDGSRGDSTLQPITVCESCWAALVGEVLWNAFSQAMAQMLAVDPDSLDMPDMSGAIVNPDSVYNAVHGKDGSEDG